MKVKITSDGTPAGTKVTNAETGEAIKGVTSIIITAQRGYMAEAVVALRGVEVDMQVSAKLADGMDAMALEILRQTPGRA